MKNLQLLFNNFDQLINTPQAISKIRGMILSLAVRGKLVPQNPKDQPAKELLKQIKEEIEKLIQQGKIKKSKPLPQIEKNEIPFEIPDSWEWVVLLDVVTNKKNSIKRGPFGSSIKKSYFVPYGRNVYKVYEQKHAISNDFSIGNYYINKQKYEELIKFKIESNDLIISCSGTIGKIAIVPKDFHKGIINQALLKIQLNRNIIINEYFKILFISYFIHEALKVSKGSAIKNIVSVSYLKKIYFPLPTLKEQKRIVEKVDQMMKLCDELEKKLQKKDKNKIFLNNSALYNLTNPKNKRKFNLSWIFIKNNFDTLYDNTKNIKKLKETILQLAVMGKLVPQNPKDQPAKELLKQIRAEKEKLIQEGKIKKSKPLPPMEKREIPFEIPDNWEWVKAGSISLNIHYGYTASAIKTNYDYKFLRITDIQNGNVNWNTVPSCEIDSVNFLKYKLKPGNILIARTGGTIGKSFLFFDKIHNALFASYLIRIIPSNKTSMEYLKIFFDSPFYWKQLFDKVSGTGQPNVNARSLSNLILPLPSYKEQKRIVEKVDKLLKLFDEIEEKIKRSSKDSMNLTESIIRKMYEK